MKQEFSNILEKYMEKDNKIVLCVGDLGYGTWDSIRSKYTAKEQFYCFGASEFTSVGITCGLANGGKIAMFYSITPFILFRAAEMIRLYMDHDRTPVKLIGAGRNLDYNQQGFTHCMPEDKEFMKLFPNIKCYWPETVEELEKIMPEFLYNNEPCYLNIKR